MIGILYESDEWSDWKLEHELEAALAETARAERSAQGTTLPGAPLPSSQENSHSGTEPSTSQDALREGAASDVAWHHVRMINMEKADAVEQAMACDLLVSRVFASAAFRGHRQAHCAMGKIISLADDEGIPLINPGRAHYFEIDKRLATETLRNAGITAPAIIAWGTPTELSVAPDELGNSYAAAFNREEAQEDSIPLPLETEAASGELPLSAPDQWPYPCIIKPNCGGRTTHTAVLRSSTDARAFLNTAPISSSSWSPTSKRPTAFSRASR